LSSDVRQRSRNKLVEDVRGAAARRTPLELVAGGQQTLGPSQAAAIAALEELDAVVRDHPPSQTIVKALADWWRSGAPRAALVGPPGSGKSIALWAWSRTIDDACLAYVPVSRVHGTACARSVAAILHPQLARHLVSPRAPALPSPASARQDIEQMLAEAGEARPMVLVLDGAEWAEWLPRLPAPGDAVRVVATAHDTLPGYASIAVPERTRVQAVRRRVKAAPEAITADTAHLVLKPARERAWAGRRDAVWGYGSDVLDAREGLAAGYLAGRGGSEWLARLVEATILLGSLDERVIRTRQQQPSIELARARPFAFADRAAQARLYVALAAELSPAARTPLLRRAERVAEGDAESLLRVAATASGVARRRIATRALAGFERDGARAVDPLLRALTVLPWVKPTEAPRAFRRPAARLLRHLDDDRVPPALADVARRLPVPVASELLDVADGMRRAQALRPFLAARLTPTARAACARDIVTRYASGASPSRIAREARALLPHLSAKAARVLVDSLGAERVTLVDALAARLAELGHLGAAETLLAELRPDHTREGQARRDVRCRLLGVSPRRRRAGAFAEVLEEASAHGDREVVKRNVATLTAALGTAPLAKAAASGWLASDTLAGIARHAEGPRRRALLDSLMRRGAAPETALAWVARDPALGGTPLTDVMTDDEARRLAVALIEQATLRGSRGEILAGWGGVNLSALAPLFARLDRRACRAVAEAATRALAR
jgi:hypothetical protein